MKLRIIAVALAVAATLSACAGQHVPSDYYNPATTSPDGKVRYGLTTQEIARNESKSAFCHDNPQVYEWVACAPKGDGDAGDE